ncbi:DEAD/DEAH box helicase [Parageobacillus thermoglucosidasius]|uniref:DEAD/DEAH box helicase n=1 Tax=Parageobacillus thermoglucosidasius TaxID=1426 RepID=UPI0021181B21|nr:DEAD/DEAH box helicase [Parageobacillus thermoglucosidasius]
MRFIVDKGRLIPEALAKTGKNAKPISHIDFTSSLQPTPGFPYSPELLSFLEGRQLLLEELPFSLHLIQTHYEHGYLFYEKGIVKTKHGWRCIRCGNEDGRFFASFPCARCHTVCTYCRKCIMMGRVSECTPLVASRFSFPQPRYLSPLSWNGTLSKGQQRAAGAVEHAVAQNSELTVWAVCGAGKTEVLFQGIARALEMGKRVCIATPRTDVVRELAPRLRRVFPGVPLIALYGGSEDRGKSAPLVISTTHQLLRFYRAFDVMVIDEVDAFPYSVEPMLEYAAAKARKAESSLIYLTATPHPAWQRDIRRGKRKAVTIPARYHGFPLPVPSFEWCGNWRRQLKRGRLPRNVAAWVLSRMETKKQAFLFVPQIDVLEQVVHIVKQWHERVEGVHAEDPERAEKVQAFRDGRIPLLVTTTILERGVTVPNIDVAVLGAEDDIFTESALVQIAGRVGRSAQHPDGDIRFFHYGKTRGMVAAKRQIERMNKEAAERGLLRTQ